jgi:hypothetical protein
VDGERKDRQGERDDSYLKKKLPSFTARWAEVIFSGEKQQVQPKVVLQLLTEVIGGVVGLKVARSTSLNRYKTVLDRTQAHAK